MPTAIKEPISQLDLCVFFKRFVNIIGVQDAHQ